jgi:hypothetical protein
MVRNLCHRAGKSSKKLGNSLFRTFFQSSGIRIACTPARHVFHPWSRRTLIAFGVCPMFDPYHKWLGIPRDRRPPTYYQLLGIPLGEADVEVIKEGALRQTSHVRMYQTGPHGPECTRLLNEIAEARATLLNPAARREYDARLGGVENQQERDSRTPSACLPQPVRSPAGKKGRWLDPAAVAYMAIVLLGGAAAFWLTGQGMKHPLPWQGKPGVATGKHKPGPQGKGSRIPQNSEARKGRAK